MKFCEMSLRGLNRAVCVEVQKLSSIELNVCGLNYLVIDIVACFLGAALYSVGRVV